ncbi:YfdX family protein [Thioclava pacifica]|uniref:YfdX protein n=1 Tax=Thioclava pacifica DSM 10166 TaxID=1353537 RepID=A0A074JQD8_9RHOB|nr:YfdX family protein [Thioclava pacifica]KEO51587.1 hypothetical protein TP2_11875 [Thioclava pacifica DSM 10166]
MKRNSKILALMLSGTLVAGPLAFNALPALADQAQPAATSPQGTDAVAKTTASSTDNELLSTVDDAYTAMREVRAARLALFDGNTDMATKMTNDAIAKMQSAETSEAKWGVPSKSGQQGVTYVPFDSSITLGEDFIVTPDNAKAVSAANDQMAKGNAKGAAETLKASNIDVSVAAAMVPAKLSLSHLQDAAKLIKAGNYYEANLALKGVEDGVVIDQWGLADLPQQAGHATKSSSNAAAPQSTMTKSNG